MVSYYFKVYIPSMGKRVSFREITIRDLININKSILNNDYGEVIECFDLIINQCCIEQNLVFTLIDKIIILLAIRAYSVSTFCEIKITDKEEAKDFDYKLEVNQLLDAILRINIPHKKETTVNELKVEYGIPFYPVKDPNIIAVSNYIHAIYHGDKLILDHTNTPEEIQTIVDSLDLDLFTTIGDYAREVNKVFQTNSLYIIKSPWDNSRELVNQKMCLDFTMYDLLKMLFTENLHNLYRSIYNFNQTLNIQPTYTENMIPVEKDLLWGYYIKDQRDAEASKSSNTKSGNFQP